MDYSVFAIGPRGETIAEDTNGVVYYSVEGGNYIPIRREEDVRWGLLGNLGSPVTKDEFYNAGNLVMNGYLVEPTDCKQITTTTSSSPSSSTESAVPLGSAQGTSGLAQNWATRIANGIVSNSVNSASDSTPSSSTESAVPLGSAQGISGLAQNWATRIANNIAFNSINSASDVGGYTTDNFSSVLETTPVQNEAAISSEPVLEVSQSATVVSGNWDFMADSEMQDTLSNQLMESADKFDAKVSLMYREIGNLSSSWVGEDYDAYFNATNGYKTALGDLSDSIRMYGKHFEKMADTTEELTTELIEIVETCTHRHVE